MEANCSNSRETGANIPKQASEQMTDKQPRPFIPSSLRHSLLVTPILYLVFLSCILSNAVGNSRSPVAGFIALLLHCRI